MRAHFGLQFEIMCTKFIKSALVYLEIEQSFILDYFLHSNVPKTAQRDP